MFYFPKEIKGNYFYFACGSNLLNLNILSIENDNYLAFLKKIKNPQFKSLKYYPRKISLKELNEYQFKSKKIKIESNTFLLINSFGYYKKSSSNSRNLDLYFECPINFPTKKLII